MRSEISLDNMHPVVHLDLHEGFVRPADIRVTPLDHNADIHDFSTGNFEGREERLHRPARAHDIVDDHYTVTLVDPVKVELPFRVAGGLVDRDLVRELVFPFPHHRHWDVSHRGEDRADVDPHRFHDDDLVHAV